MKSAGAGTLNLDGDQSFHQRTVSTAKKPRATSVEILRGSAKRGVMFVIGLETR
jgi:hypothetical protein